MAMSPKHYLLAAALSVAAISPAHAVFINFDSLPGTNQTSGTPPASAVLTDDLDALGIIFGRAGISAGVAVNAAAAFSSPHGISGLDVNGTIPAHSSGDIYFSFVVPNTTIAAVTNSVSFYIGDGGGDLDIFQVRSYNIANVLVDTQNVSGNSYFQVSVIDPAIHRIEVDFDNNSNAGFTLDNLSFNDPGAVPDASSSMLLVLAGLASLVGLRRRK